MTRSSVDPLRPLETLVSTLLGVLVTFLVVGLALFVGQRAFSDDDSISFAGLSEDSACVRVDTDLVPTSVSDVGPGSERDYGSWRIRGLRSAEAAADLASWDVCVVDPALGVRAAAASLTLVPFSAFPLLSLWLTRRTIRAGRRTGLFSLPTADAVRTLGRFLLAWAVVVPFLLAGARGVVLDAAITDVPWVAQFLSPVGSWLLLVVAIGVVTTGRVLRGAVDLQHEVDATV